MDAVLVIAIALFVAGFFFGFVGVAKYSDFIARVQRLDRSLYGRLTLDLDVGEGWSSQNVKVGMYFLKRSYMELGDAELRRLGGRIRTLNVVSMGCAVTGLLLLACRDVVAR